MRGEDIRDQVRSALPAADQAVALEFVDFLRAQGLELVRDTGSWREKIYYWVKRGGDCVCFIAMRDPDEPQNRWTVWSGEMSDEALTNKGLSAALRRAAWAHVDVCAQCGSCGGGRRRIIFGQAFDAVGGCTFRFDNPGPDDLALMKEMVRRCAP